MPSFDIVCQIDAQELDNAINQARREVQTRFDFKGSQTTIEMEPKSQEIVLNSESEGRVKAILDILQSKLVRRGISLKAARPGPIEPAAGGRHKQTLTLQQGIPIEKCREIVKRIKGTKKKVQAAIQADQVRVSGKSLDDLQSIIALFKEDDLGIEMQFVNMRSN
ncbi:MAG: YajQ family cyclic di-GMP-binding protein [Deltaproteobacteria bacterium]|nr:YajQ family cyclic di-GMP-binding protein [Deltaproteobacteria bacterium]